jgi:phosphatidylglycerophosphatase A
MTRLIATFFYVGLLKPAPGTWGSLAAQPVLLGLHWAGGPFLVLAALGAVVALGTWATTELTRGTHADPSWIVIDEVAGQWVALLPVTFGAWWVGAEITALWPGWIAAFVLFRVFDIWKPGPVGWADRLHTPWGVMLDDLIAGAMAGLCVIVLAAVAHLPVIL